MTAAPIHLAGERLMLDPMGAAFWPAQKLLVVSDLHLEKGTAFARQGMLLPPWDTQATLERLALLLRRWSPDTVVALGDSFHDAGGAARLPPAEATRLRAMTAAHRFVWIEGNHDPAAPEGLGGEPAGTLRTGKLTFRHEGAGRAETAEVVGHHHPKATVQARTGPLTRPCFVFDGRRLMMPAFGEYTGGLDVRDPAISRLFPRGGRVFLLGRDRLFSFGIGGGAALRIG
jgi:hypothetical protein